MPLAVMLTSLVCNCRGDRDLEIYVIASDVPDALREKIEGSVLANKKGAYRLTFHWSDLDADLLRHLPIGGGVNSHITADSYSRLLAPDVLPANCARAVYLDSDLVVIKDIGALYEAADDAHTVAAVSAVSLPYVSTDTSPTGPPVVFNYTELGIPPTNRYFNAGVLVINLKRWREQNITARVIAYLERYQDQVLYHDQGGLNAILFDQWQRLDQRWNHTGALYPEDWLPPAYTREDWLKVRTDPFIVHYLGGDKPWKPGFKRPRGSFFYRYLRKTRFKDDLKMPRIAVLEYLIGYKTYYTIWRIKRRLDSLFSKSESSD